MISEHDTNDLGVERGQSAHKNNMSIYSFLGLRRGIFIGVWVGYTLVVGQSSLTKQVSSRVPVHLRLSRRVDGIQWSMKVTNVEDYKICNIFTILSQCF